LIWEYRRIYESWFKYFSGGNLFIIKAENERGEIMSFCWVTITVNSMEESLKFYQEIVGLPVNRRFKPDTETEIAFLGEGETKIELLYDPNRKISDNLKGISLGFKVDSVDEKIDFLNKKGIKITAGPVQPNPYIKFFFIKDPNGVNIQFAQDL